MLIRDPDRSQFKNQLDPGSDWISGNHRPIATISSYLCYQWLRNSQPDSLSLVIPVYNKPEGKGPKRAKHARGIELGNITPSLSGDTDKEQFSQTTWKASLSCHFSCLIEFEMANWNMIWYELKVAIGRWRQRSYWNKQKWTKMYFILCYFS